MSAFDASGLSYDELKDALPYIGARSPVTLPLGMDTGDSAVQVAFNSGREALMLVSINMLASGVTAANTLIFGPDPVVITSVSTAMGTGEIYFFDLGAKFVLIPPGRALYAWPVSGDLPLSAAIVLNVYQYTLSRLPVQFTKEVENGRNFSRSTR